MVSLFRNCLLIIAIVFIHISVSAQATKLSGTVSDRSNQETLTGATIKIIETGEEAITDFDGNFTFADLKPGTYTISVTFISYNAKKLSKIHVQADNITNLKVDLEKSATVNPVNNRILAGDKINIYAGTEMM